MSCTPTENRARKRRGGSLTAGLEKITSAAEEGIVEMMERS